jgi:hypothetical protein
MNPIPKTWEATMKVKTLGLIAGLALCGTAFAQYEQQQSQMGQQQKSQEQKGQKELNGTVVGIRRDDVLVRLNDDPGAIVSLKVDHQTQLDGKQLKKDQPIESHLKKEFSPGAEVRASFSLEKMDNKAASIEHKK